ncbi:MAG TPA: hypothetical protein VMR74_10340 [Gammaproteobacteria bacterium]|nr:hypothetical protein [Gammaproteobacteria bacterium]
MSDDAQSELKEVERAAQAASAERNVEIERLNRAVAEERQHSTELRRTVDELRFKMDILERGYSKQLADTRALCESAEARREEIAVRAAELDAARGDAIELLEAAKVELDRLAKERDLLRKRLASRDGWQVEGAGDEVGFDDGEGTINGLLNDDKWLARAESEHQRQIRERKSVEVAEESPTEDLIAPEVVLTRKGARE